LRRNVKKKIFKKKKGGGGGGGRKKKKLKFYVPNSAVTHERLSKKNAIINFINYNASESYSTSKSFVS